MNKNLVIFLVISFISTILYGRILWYLSEKSKVFKKLVFFIMPYLKIYDKDKLSIIILNFIYLFFGLIIIIFFAFFYDFNFLAFFKINKLIFSYIILGFAAEISLIGLFTFMMKALKSKWNIYETMKNIPWIEAIYNLPKIIRYFSPSLAGFIEECFFRGILFLILFEIFKIKPLFCIIYITILFILHQILQTKTKAQAILIGSSSFAISLVGSILVIITNSILPAAIVHACFVMFYFISEPPKDV